MLLNASNAGIVKASLDNGETALLSDETTDHEALLEATTSLELLPDVTQRSLPDETPSDNDKNKKLPEVTDNPNEHLPDETTVVQKGILPDETKQLVLDEPKQIKSNSPDAKELRKLN